jgi:hypothetical protein
MFPLLSMEQSNPGLWGAQRVGDIFQRILENQKLGQENRYRPDSLGAELNKAQLYNQYYGPNIETEMKLRNQQGKAAAAHAGLMGQQAQWVGPTAQSEIKLRDLQGGKFGAETAGKTAENTFFNSLFNDQQNNQQVNTQPAIQYNQPIAPSNQPQNIPSINSVLQKNNAEYCIANTTGTTTDSSTKHRKRATCSIPACTATRATGIFEREDAKIC